MLLQILIESRSDSDSPLIEELLVGVNREKFRRRRDPLIFEVLCSFRFNDFRDVLLRRLRADSPIGSPADKRKICNIVDLAL